MRRLGVQFRTSFLIGGTSSLTCHLDNVAHRHSDIRRTDNPIRMLLGLHSGDAILVRPGKVM